MQSKQGGFPPQQYSRMEAAKSGPETHKMVSDKHGIVMGGLMATRFIFFDADGTVANEVTRIGRQERKVQAPICIKRYKECNSGPA
jgi:hypothetical protein